VNGYTETVYEKISSESFYDGMRLEGEIYYCLNGKYILAFKNSTINNVILSKLKSIEATYGGLYVSLGEYEHFINQISKQTEMRSFNELKIEQEKLIGSTCTLFESAARTSSLNLNASEHLAVSIKDRMFTVSVANLIHLINGVRNVDTYLYTHSTNVAILNGLMGKWLGLSDDEIEKLIKIGLIHDIGKIRIPDKIINKPAILTPAEFEVMKTHSVFSYEMIKAAGETDPEILSAVRGHHEKTNGTGYPDGLTAANLSLFTRITTISDIYDAMVARRVYKEAHSPFEILDEFSRDKFSNLDTHLINVFLTNMPQELAGKKVELSDGRIGRVVYINRNKFAFPFVQIGDDVIETNEDLKCLCVFDE
jgi:HD-GYP domain-containing protein (c-di-GMP phosphodiesterase class II)